MMNAEGERTALLDGLRAASPALARRTRETLFGEVWNRPELNARDRSLVTAAALVARCQTAAMPDHFHAALDAGVTPGELSELVLHLAYYSGWPNAVAAAEVLKDVFAQHGIGAEQLPEEAPMLLPLDEEAEAKRAAAVQQNLGEVAPGVVQYTTDLLFRDLWLRPGLAPRDRSLVTVSALTASGQVAQITFHLNKAMDNGLSQQQASELFTHLAFYAGWPHVMSALPVAKAVFESRAKERT